MTLKELALMRDVQIDACDPDTLVDLQSVTIDRTKPIAERVEAFIKAVGNPYLFKVGDVIVKVNFDPNGKPFSDAIISAILAS